MKDLKSFFVSDTDTIADALLKLDQASKKILLLVSEHEKFSRTITDGDLRRLLLLGFSLKEKLKVLPEKKSFFATSGDSPEKILQLMNDSMVSAIPILNEDEIPIDILFKEDIESNRIFLSVPHLSGDEYCYVEEAFNSNWIAPLGPNVDAFEKELEAYHGNNHYVTALNSGTSAIHLAIKLLGVKEGEFVLCSSFTFSASANPILYEGAIPVFIDSEPSTWCMSPEALKKAIIELGKKNIKPKAIVVVHLYGQSANMDEISSISKEFAIPIIEDAAEAIGSEYKGKKCGTIGDIGVFSFNGNKIITTSGGGALISENRIITEKAKYFATQARTPNKPYYEHYDVGYNYRMSNILAGIGRAQLGVLDRRVLEKRKIFEYYKGKLDLDFIEWQPEPKGSYSNRWLAAFVVENKYRKYIPHLIEFLAKKNIETRHVWKPLNSQPIFKKYLYFTHSNISVCEDIYERGVCLPSSSSITPEEQNKVIESIKDFFRNTNED